MIGFVNLIIKALAALVISILNILPETPFSWDLGSLGTYWAYANYFIPFGTLAGIMATFLISVMVWYGIRWILRVAKYID